MNTIRHIITIGSAATLLALAGTAAADEYYYTIMGPTGPVFRHVIEDPTASCVNAQVVGGPRRGELAMTVRFRGADADSQDERRLWPITVCEATLTYEEAAAAVSVAMPPAMGSDLARAFRLPKTSPDRIGIIGDTGCKVKNEDGTYVGQDCAHDWPLERIADRLVAADVDLVLHVGDFIYRKAECPPDRQDECGGSPFGTRWATLEAEIMRPTVALQRQAPWVVPRGNHENCDAKKDLAAQGGIGAFILVDPRPSSEVIFENNLSGYLKMLQKLVGKLPEDDRVASACSEKTARYIVPVGDHLELWVLDSNEPEDDRQHAVTYKDTLIPSFTADFKWFSDHSARKQRILVTHRPLYGLFPGKRKKLIDRSTGQFDPIKVRKAPLVEQNVTLQEAFERAKRDGMENTFELAITGHNHVVQWVAVDDLPPNLTVGNSGTALDTHFEDKDTLRTIEIRDRSYRVGLGEDDQGIGKNASGFTMSKTYGYAVLSRVPRATKWTLIRLHDDAGGDLAQCSSTNGPWTCRKSQ